jgi:hypothetical protein
MAQLNATKKNLKHAFQEHFNLYKSLDTTKHQISRRLILFYAVEVGLKYYLLNKFFKKNTDDLEKYIDATHRYYNGHDIKSLLKYANCNGEFISRLGHFETEKKQQVEPYQFHQIWRYGIKARKENDEDNAENALKDIAQWLEPLI